jgi:hypothetical protein
MRPILDIADDILQRASSLVLDEVCWLVVRGNLEEAVRTLLEAEGHWLDFQEGAAFVDHVRLNVSVVGARP